MESYCSKSLKKKNGDAESFGGRFWGEQWFFSLKFGDVESVGDVLKATILLRLPLTFPLN